MIRVTLIVFGLVAGFGIGHTEPTAEMILEKVAKALGGKRFKEMKSLSAHGSLFIDGADLTGSCTVLTKAPGMSRMTVKITDMMESVDACDGKSAWDYNPFFATIRTKTKKELAYSVLHSRTDLLTDYAKYFDKWSVLRRSKVNGHVCHVLKMTPKKNKVAPFLYYVDEDSFLILREENVYDGVQGKFTITSDVDEYVEVDGIKVPKRLTIGMSQMKIKVSFDKIKVNEPLPDALFANPNDLTVSIRQINDLDFVVGGDNPVTMNRKQLVAALTTVNSVKKGFSMAKIILSGSDDVGAETLVLSSRWLMNLAKKIEVVKPKVTESATSIETPESKKTDGDKL